MSYGGSYDAYQIWQLIRRRTADFPQGVIRDLELHINGFAQKNLGWSPTMSLIRRVLAGTRVIRLMRDRINGSVDHTVQPGLQTLAENQGAPQPFRDIGAATRRLAAGELRREILARSGSIGLGRSEK